MSPRKTLRGKRHQRTRAVVYAVRCNKRNGRRIKQYARMMRRMVLFAQNAVNVVQNLASAIQKASEVIRSVFLRMAYPDGLSSGNSERINQQES